MANVFLKNTVSKWQSNSIDLHSAYVILSAQTMDQIKNWYVFVDDDSDTWIHIMDSAMIINLLKTGGELVKPPMSLSQVEPQLAAVPDLPKAEPKVDTKIETIEIPKEFFNPESHAEMTHEALSMSVIGEAEVAIDSTESALPHTVPEIKQYANKRMHPRFDIRLRVIIKSGKHTFLTYTSDVSLGGMNLVNDVPEYIFNSEAEIYISAPDQKNNLKLICSPVASNLGKSRLMFTKIEDNKQKVLATWLHHVIKPNATKVTRSS